MKFGCQRNNTDRTDDDMACPVGYYGSYCDIVCPIGNYGLQCAGLCPPKCLKETCHHVYGCLESNTGQTPSKPSECPKGYHGSFCNTTCPIGTYGVKCAGSCLPKCSNETCHNVYGCLESTTARTQADNSGENPYSTTAATQLINISDVSSFDEKNHNCLTFQQSGNHLNRSYLLVSIGLMLLIAIIFTITNVWLTYRAKRTTQWKKRTQNEACNADPNLHLPLDTAP